MKRAARLLLALACAASVFSQTPAPADLPAPRRGDARFYEAHAQHLNRVTRPMDLLFLGDSITAGWLTRAQEIWEVEYGKYRAANFGISSDRTQHVLWRIEDGVLDQARPRVVVLLIGINNSADHTGKEIAAANGKIVTRIRERIPGVKVLVLGLFPVGPRTRRDGTFDDGVKRMEAVAAANTLLAKLDDGVNVRFLDFGAKFLGLDGKISYDLMPDQLHPSAAGYRVWADAMRPLLEEMMK